MNAIVAVYSDWGIGYNGRQTIVIPEDRKRFRELTTGGVVVAGRKTYEELRMSLPNRRNIVLTRDREFTALNADVAHSVAEVLALVADDDPGRVFVIGGGEIYRLFLSICSFAYVTKINAFPMSDTFFPNLDEMPEWSHKSKSEIRESENRESGNRKSDTENQKSETGVEYSFMLYRNNCMQQL